METFTLRDYSIQNKTVFLRVDYNVPLEEGKVSDDIRIRLSLPTIKFLLANNCKIVLATHLGRPDGKVVPEFKVDPVAEKLVYSANRNLFRSKMNQLDLIGPGIGFIRIQIYQKILDELIPTLGDVF